MVGIVTGAGGARLTTGAAIALSRAGIEPGGTAILPPHQLRDITAIEDKVSLVEVCREEWRTVAWPDHRGEERNREEQGNQSHSQTASGSGQPPGRQGNGEPQCSAILQRVGDVSSNSSRWDEKQLAEEDLCVNTDEGTVSLDLGDWQRYVRR